MMSRQTWFDIQATVARHQALLQEQERQSSEGYGWMDLEQMRFIASLSPAGPLDAFIHALDTLSHEVVRKYSDIGYIDMKASR